MKAAMNDYMMSARSLVKIGTTAAGKKAYFGLNSAKSRLGIDGMTLTPANIAALAADLDIPEPVIVEMNMRLQSDVLLNAPILANGDARDGEAIDLIADASLIRADDMMISSETQAADADALADALATLNPRERYVLEQRELSEEPKTLQTLSNELGVSRERSRQIGARALEKISERITGTKKPKLPKAQKPPKEVRDQRFAFVRANIDKMTAREMAKALDLPIKTLANYVRAVRAEQHTALPVAA